MATYDMGTVGPYPAYSRHRSMCVAHIEMNVNATTISNVVDDGNVLDHTTVPAHTGHPTHRTRLTLRERWKYIGAMVSLDDPAVQVMVDVSSAGSSAVNVVDIYPHVATVIQDYTAADNTLRVTLFLSR